VTSTAVAERRSRVHVMVKAVVREWHEDLGWGVLDSAETPGGCWAHYSSIDSAIISQEAGHTASEYKTVRPDELVELEWEAADQDGFGFRAVRVQRHES
jgi:CspA family cold shock protein